MKVYRKYFKIENGPLIDAVKKIEQINDAAHTEYVKILKEIGAEPGYYYRDRKLVSIVFKNDPDTRLYKIKDSGWYPKKNCKAGKELSARIEEIKTKAPIEALKVVGLSTSPSIFCGGHCYKSTLVVIPEKRPLAYISVPWFDEAPEKIEQYKKDHAAGKCSDINHEAITWMPTPEMIEIKGWEVDRAIDEWNEKIKAKQTTE